MPTQDFFLSTTSFRSVKLFVPVLKCCRPLLPNQLSKEALRRCSALETTGPFQSLCISLVIVVCVASCSGLMCLRSIKPRLSRNLLKFSKNSNLFEIFHTVWKPSILSGNLPDCPEFFQSVRKSSRLSGNHLHCQKIFKTVRNLFQTVQIFSRPSVNCQDCPEIFHTVRKSSRLSKNLPDCPEHFPDCTEIFHSVQKFSRLSGNLPDCLEIFQTIRKYSRYLTELLFFFFFKSEMIFLNGKIFFPLEHFPDSNNFPGSNATLLPMFFSLWVSGLVVKPLRFSPNRPSGPIFSTINCKTFTSRGTKKCWSKVLALVFASDDTCFGSLRPPPGWRSVSTKFPG